MRRKRCDTGAMDRRVISLRKERMRMRSSSESVEMMSRDGGFAARGGEGRERFGGCVGEESASLRFAGILRGLGVVSRASLREHLEELCSVDLER